MMHLDNYKYMLQINTYIIVHQSIPPLEDTYIYLCVCVLFVNVNDAYVFSWAVQRSIFLYYTVYTFAYW